MEKPLKGDIVVIPFPFSNLAQAKRRPALVLASLIGDDVILCQITSQETKDRYSIQLGKNDFNQGGLSIESNIRPNRLFTADKNIILYKAGSLQESKLDEIIQKTITILKR